MGPKPRNRHEPIGLVSISRLRGFGHMLNVGPKPGNRISHRELWGPVWEPGRVLARLVPRLLDWRLLVIGE
eukprot:9720235-Alexandrium_andersonii.AAC.1